MGAEGPKQAIVVGAEVAAWSPSRATEAIRRYAASPGLAVSYKVHATEQLAKRDLTMGDVLHVLKTGYVYADATAATQAGRFKYAMEGTSPNSKGRSLRVIVIPSHCRPEMKIVTVMWVDKT